MYKYVFIITICLFILFPLTSCGQSNEVTNEITTEVTNEITNEQQMLSPHPFALLGFTSLEEFFNAYEEVRMGRATGEFLSTANRINFLSLEEIYMPVNIPTGYIITFILVMERNIIITFTPIEPLDGQDIVSQEFRFFMTRNTYDDLIEWGHETPLDGVMGWGNAIPENLINGRYFFDGRRFSWAQGPNRLSLEIPYMPATNNDANNRHEVHLDAAIQNFTAATLYDLLPLNQFIAVDLSDTALIQAIVNTEQAGQTFSLEHYNQHVAHQQVEHR